MNHQFMRGVAMYQHGSDPYWRGRDNSSSREWRTGAYYEWMRLHHPSEEKREEAQQIINRNSK